MSYRDDKKRGEKPSYSSPEAFRQDRKEEARRNIEKTETKNRLNALKLRCLERQIKQKRRKSRPVKERKKEVATAHERDKSAKEFLEKQRLREEERQSAIKRGEPRQRHATG